MIILTEALMVEIPTNIQQVSSKSKSIKLDAVPIIIRATWYTVAVQLCQTDPSKGTKSRDS